MGILKVKTKDGYVPVGGVSDEQIARVVEDYLADHPTGDPDSGGNVDLTGYATEEWVGENYQPKGDYLTAIPDGYAKTEDIPTKPEDIGAQPSGNYALKSEIPSVPVQSVNGKTGAVQLSAADVKARPENWIPTAQEVGALPNTYTPPNQTADQVGADPKGTAASAVSQHNTADDSHNDLRLELKALSDRINAALDSDDTTLDELSEIVAYITSNKSLIDSITTSKVSVADIVNNLTSNVSNKPLSAAQGVVLKGLIDTLSGNLANYQPKGDYALRSELPTVPTKVSAFENDKGYLTQHQDISGKVNKNGLTLGVYTDGLIYVFVDGQPVGNGVELPTGGIDGYVDSDKNIVVRGLADGSYKFYFEMEDGSLSDGYDLVKDSNVYYSVTNNLTQCTNSNSAKQAIGGQSYSATITAKSGYELKSVTVTMGGSPVTVSGGVINIANVTGNIVITATATEIVVTPSYTNLFVPSEATINKRTNSSYAVVDADGYVITNFIDVKGKVPFTDSTKIYIKGAGFTNGGDTHIRTYTTTGTTYNNAFSSGNGPALSITDEGNGVISVNSLKGSFSASVVRAYLCLKVSSSAITAADIQNIVITIDEPIA